MKALLLALALGMVPPQAPPPEVRGRVLSETTGVPLPYARVEVLGVAGGVTYADSAGWYALRNIPPGRRTVRASSVDHSALEVEVQVPPSGNLRLYLELQLQPVVMQGVRGWAVAQRGSGSDTVALPMPALGAASARALETTTPALVELGLAKAGGSSPTGPGHSPVDPAAALYVRGAASDLKLMLLDGAPVYTPFHLAGLISAFEAGVLQAANLYLGGAPARYDGGLSSVLDLETRAGRRPDWHVAGGADLVSGRAVVDGPLGPHATLLASGRAIHGYGAEVLARERFPYQYLDGLLRLDLALGSAGSLSATAFRNREAVRLDGGDGYADGGSLQTERTAVWGNAAGSLRYRGAIRGTEAEVTVAGGSFTTRLPVGSVRPWVVDGGARRLRVATDLRQPLGNWLKVEYGAAFDRLELAYYTHSRDAEAPLWIRSEPVGEVLGGYVDTRWTAFPQLQLRGGLRLDTYSTQPGPRIAPRLSARWLLTDRAALTLAGGVFRQYMRVPLPASAAAGGEVRWQGDHGYVMALPEESGGVQPLTIARASHLTVQLDQELGEGIRLGLEGYYKQFTRLPGPGATSAEASGFDVWTRRTHGRLVGWAGYSLAWIWSAEGEPDNLTTQFAGRHLVSAGVSGPLAWGGGFEVRLAYGAGLPYTPVSEPPLGDVAFGIIDNNPLRTADAANREAPPLMGGAPEESYLRVDASISRTWRYERPHRPPMEITPYLKVLNALDRRDALFWYVDPTGTQTRAMASLPVLPILGLDWRF